MLKEIASIDLIVIFTGNIFTKMRLLQILDLYLNYLRKINFKTVFFFRILKLPYKKKYSKLENMKRIIL